MYPFLVPTDDTENAGSVCNCAKCRYKALWWNTACDQQGKCLVPLNRIFHNFLTFINDVLKLLR